MDRTPPNREVLEYFMKMQEQKFQSVECKLARIEGKLEELIGFRWMVIGASAAVSAVVGLVIAFFGK